MLYTIITKQLHPYLGENALT